MLPPDHNLVERRCRILQEGEALRPVGLHDQRKPHQAHVIRDLSLRRAGWLAPPAQLQSLYTDKFIAISTNFFEVLGHGLKKRILSQ